MTDADRPTGSDRRTDGESIGTAGRVASRPLAVLLVAAVALGAAAALAGIGLAVAAGTATAGDNVAVYSPTPSEVEAEPGETFTVDVRMTSHGAYEAHVVAVDFVALYHPDYLEIVDAERGPWLEQGEDTEIRSTTTLAHEEGMAIVEQRRDPPAGGATGTDYIATVEIRVAEDAPPSEAVVDFSESVVTLESQYPQPVHDQNVTVSIAGGGERHEPFDHADPTDVMDEGSTSDDEGQGTSATESTEAESGAAAETGPDGDGSAGADAGADADGDDSIPGFAAPAAVGAVVAAVVGLAVARAVSRRR